MPTGLAKMNMCKVNTKLVSPPNTAVKGSDHSKLMVESLQIFGDANNLMPCNIPQQLC